MQNFVNLWLTVMVVLPQAGWSLFLIYAAIQVGLSESFWVFASFIIGAIILGLTSVGLWNRIWPNKRIF